MNVVIVPGQLVVPGGVSKLSIVRFVIRAQVHTFGLSLTLQSPANLRVCTPWPVFLPSYDSIVIKGWDKTSPSRLGAIRSRRGVQWTHSRIFPEPPAISSSESSLSEELMQGRHRFCREFVTQRRAQRSTGLIDRDIARGYVLVPSGHFRSHILARFNSTQQ